VARNGYTVNITPKYFTRMVSNLQQPLREEHAIKIDGSDLDPEEVYRALDL
jgi:hypothetical protein